MNSNHVIQTENVVTITFLCLFVNACKFGSASLPNKGNSLSYLNKPVLSTKDFHELLFLMLVKHNRGVLPVTHDTERHVATIHQIS